VYVQSLCSERAQQALWAACYWLLSRDPARQRLAVHLPSSVPQALASGLLLAGEVASVYLCERALFWQLPQPWLGSSSGGVYPQQMQFSDGKRHPRRAPKPRGEVYRRFDARLGAWVSLRTLEIDQDGAMASGDGLVDLIAKGTAVEGIENP
jgi:acetyl CoA:N6-hydroxylysine acetyl transferase